MTIAEFITHYAVTMRCSAGAPINWDFPDSDGWIVALYLGRENCCRTTFYMGVGRRTRSFGNKQLYGHYDKKVMLCQVKLPNRRMTQEGAYARAVEALYGDLLVRPKPGDILASIRDELLTLQETGTFENFQREMGYGEESGNEGEAERMWSRITQQAQDVRRWLGTVYDTFLTCVPE